jgi:hypothetical protein
MKQTGVTSVFKSGAWANISLGVLVSIACAGYSLPAFSQDATAPVGSGGVVKTAPVIPQQVRYAGQLTNRSGDTLEAVFSIYAAPEGGEPLWTETQQVSVDMNGSYTVLLGSTSTAGLPQTLFVGGAARWLGVSVERAPEMARVLLSSVPYAMKSADAQSLAGHPAADFVTQAQLAQLSTQREQNPEPAITPLTSGTVTGSGTAGNIPMWTGTLTQGNSEMVQVGSDIGINEATPVATLDVNGSAMIRGTMTSPAVGTATTATGYASQVWQWNPSVWSTTAGAAVAPAFRMYASPIGNNTATPSAELVLSYQLGASHAPLFIMSSTGALTAYGGLTATAPTVATASAGVNSPLLGLSASSYNSSSSHATPENFAWQALSTGNDTSTPSANLSLLFGTTAPPAPTGLSISTKGLITFATGQTFPVTGTGGGTITGITTTSPLTGSGTSGSVALGLNQSALTTDITPGLESTFDSRYAKLSGGNVFSSYQEAYQTSGPGTAALLSWGTNGSVGAFGNSDTGYGVQGESTSGYGVYAQVTTPASGSAGVLGFTGTSFSGSYASESGVANAGIWADNSKVGTGIPLALFATADDAYGEAIVTNGNDYPSLFVDNNTGTAGEFEATTGYGVNSSTGSGTGVYGSTNGGGDGVEGYNADTGAQDAGVLGVANTSSVVYGSYNIYAGVWGDTGTSSTTVSPAWAIGVLGTADDSHAGVFLNNSTDWSTLYVSNSSTGGTGLFTTMMASSADGTCGIGGGGGLTCTGPIKSLASAGSGARTVETYGVQSPENWMEDFGTGQLEKGAAVVSLDPTFAETVTETADYHVFLTPRGDSKGLYVTNVTPTSFEVRESGGGTSSLSFDYRIVAKRRGYEAMRHVDVTERYNAELKAAAMARQSGPVRRPVALAKSPLQLALNSHPRRIMAARTPVPHKPLTPPANTPAHH